MNLGYHGHPQFLRRSNCLIGGSHAARRIHRQSQFGEKGQTPQLLRAGLLELTRRFSPCRDVFDTSSISSDSVPARWLATATACARPSHMC